MKEVNINISIAIHSKSIALFRHCLGLILVLNGLSYLIFENVRIISKHRIMAPRKSRIWPLNLFDLGGEFWAYFLINISWIYKEIISYQLIVRNDFYYCLIKL